MACALAWESLPIDITADAALQAVDVQAKTSGGTSASAEAEEFLRDLLTAGPVSQKEIRAAAEGAGLSWATVRRAKDRLKIKPDKDGMKGGWLWALPKVLIAAEDAHLKDMSAFGSDEHLRGNGAAATGSDDGLEIPECLDRRGELRQ